MRIERRSLIATGVLLAIGGALLWTYSPREQTAPSPTSSPTDHGNPPSTAASLSSPNTATGGARISAREVKQHEIIAAYSTPIAVHGKVVDHFGNSIPDATVSIGIADRPFETGSSYTRNTDGAGLFSLSDVHGIAFSVSASKPGYYSTAASTGHRNVITPSNDDAPQPSKGDPLVLVLHKQGRPVPLILMRSGQIDLARTGKPLLIDLATGRKGLGNLILASWVGNGTQYPLDWRYRLTIPSGGLVERKGEFDFEAPAEGYQATAEIASTTENSSSKMQREYFAKLADGKYARFLIRFYPQQRRNFVVVESYVNPTPGDRNLEVDSKKVAQP